MDEDLNCFEDLLPLIMKKFTERSVNAEDVAESLSRFVDEFPDAELRRKAKPVIRRLNQIAQARI